MKVKLMADITVGDIKKITKGKLLCGNEYDICENFCIDSREIKSGDVFVGIKGERVNGNELYEEVLKKGAKCLILENVEIPEDIIKKYTDSAIIIVEDTIKALQQIAESIFPLEKSSKKSSKDSDNDVLKENTLPGS